ncbi:MAG TPA: HAD family hydrolase [Candidatus Cryptobacteroides pullicola]|nr:HAD family hydrolase [Candidatus Cryptobacteroides pullicola]
MEKNIAERIKVVVFDADDTLWANQPYFDEAEDRYSSLLSDYGEAEYIKGELFSTEMRNMDELGFGATAFTLSMIETALRIGGESLPVSAISDIYAIGRSLLRIPATPLEGVEDTLQKLSASHRFRLVVLTKGNLLDQERKLERSGLGRYFDHVEIVSDKNEKTYSDFVSFLGVEASEMMMVGNSFKSDIAPVLAIGGYGAYIPFHTTWQHERAEEYAHPRLIRLDSLGQLPGMLLQATMPESSGKASIM